MSSSERVDGPRRPEVVNRWKGFLRVLWESNIHRNYIPGIHNAFDHAQSAHTGQERKSGKEWAIEHPIAVATIGVREARIKNPVIIKGALLHDIPEDSVEITEDGRVFFMGKEFRTNLEFREMAYELLKYRHGKPTARIVGTYKTSY